MRTYSPQSTWEKIAFVAAIYGAWLVTIALGAAIFYQWHRALLAAYIGLRLDKWAYAAFNNGVVILLALAWIVLVIATESWYRNARTPGGLAWRFVRMAAAEVVVLGLGFVLPWIV